MVNFLIPVVLWSVCFKDAKEKWTSLKIIELVIYFSIGLILLTVGSYNSYLKLVAASSS